MATLKIPSPLRSYTAGQAEIHVQGENVGAALDDLVTQFPPLRQHLFSSKGELRPFVNLYLNQEDIRHLQGTDTPLRAEDKLMIIPSIAGG